MSNVTVQYAPGTGTRRAADNVTLAIPSTGYTLGIVGESGSGKTTLGLSIMNLIDPPGRITGRIEFKGKNVLGMSKSQLRGYRWREVSMVYQSAMNALNPVKTISNHLVEVLRTHSDTSKSDAKEKALSLLSDVGIKLERADAYSHELSGGMRQRAIIALALSLSPKLLIADEPTSALDVVVQRQILALLKKRVSEAGLSLLYITHEIAILGGLVDHVAVMFAGEIVERGPIGKVLFEPLHPYTQMLLSSLLSLDSNRSSLTATSEKEKDTIAIPEEGCKFVYRCKYAFARCKFERPVLKETEDGRLVACHKYND
jgi:oligopeptide/dipeptide ABC transporter ATP-binding protein